MKFRTGTGATLEVNNPEVAEMYKQAGYEVLTEKPVTEKPAKEKTTKKVEE